MRDVAELLEEEQEVLAAEKIAFEEREVFVGVHVYDSSSLREFVQDAAEDVQDDHHWMGMKELA